MVVTTQFDCAVVSGYCTVSILHRHGLSAHNEARLVKEQEKLTFTKLKMYFYTQIHCARTSLSHLNHWCIK